MQDRDLLLLDAASAALNSYLDAVNKDETFELKKKRWLEVKKAITLLETISPELKEKFIKTHNLPPYQKA